MSDTTSFDPTDNGAAFAQSGASTDSIPVITDPGVVANHIVGAQLDASDQGDPGLAARLGDFVTKGLPLTGLAVVNSFYNTAVEVGNVFGAGAQKATVEDELGNDSDYTKYYQRNSGLIEGLGLVAGSFLPGLGAVKALKLAQAGSFGEKLSAATGLFSRVSDGALEAATADAAGNATGTSLFGLNAVNKAKTVLAGAADQALQGAVFQTAALATMKASPLLDNNTISDNVKSVAESALGFGVLGGGIEGLGKLSSIAKAGRAADFASKGAEVSGSAGLGNLTPGDRVVSLYDGLDQAAQPTAGSTELTPLQQRKLTYNQQQSSVNIHAALTEAAGGDKDVATAFKNFLDQGRADGTLDSNAIQNLTGQLSGLGRHGDISVTSSPSNAFFLPKQIDASIVADAGPIDLLHPNPTAAGNPTARAYSLTDPNVPPVIGKATDTVGVPGGVQAPKFAGAQDAYKQGVDLYLDAKGVVHANPGSTAFAEIPLPGTSRVLSVAERKQYVTTGTLPEDAKPLNAVGTTLNLKTGTLFGESPLPVVGDIAPPKLVLGGLKVGDTLFPQKTGIDFSTVTNPMDANARYQWALQRGVRAADPIASNDLPMLEQAYREVTVDPTSLTSKGITNFSDTGAPIPSNAADLLQHIADTKAALMPDLISAGKNTDEIGHLLNAPDAGMSNMFAGTDPASIIRDTAGDAQINHVRLAYDIGTTRNNEGDLLRGAQMTAYRTQLAREATDSAGQNFLAKQFGGTPGVDTTQLFSRLKFTKGVDEAGIQGAGPGFLTNANADYGTFAQQSERIGSTVAQLKVIQQSKTAGALGSAANALRQDPEVAAEVGAFTAARHSTGENYVLLNDADAAANGLGKNTVVLEGARQIDPKTGAVTVDKNYIPPGFATGGTPGNKLQTYYNLSDKALAWEQANQTLRNARNDLRSQFELSQGIKKPGYNPDVLYAPPINTQRYPYLAYVRQREGYALGESGASVITARSAEELQGKIAQLGPEYDAFTKEDVANFKKMQGEYEYNRNFNNSKVDSELRRKGILNNVVPESRAENIIGDAVSHHNAQDAHLLQDHVELLNPQVFAQLRDMGSRFANTGTSFFGRIAPSLSGAPNNPYQSYINTALAKGPKDLSPLWAASQEKLEQFGNTAFNAVRDSFGALQKGLVTPEQASAVAEKFGLGNPYGTGIEAAQKYYGGLANALPDPRVLSKFVGTANSALGATVIRLDAMQQLIHAVTTPIMASMEYASATGAKSGLSDLLTSTSPSGTQVPSFARVLYRAVRNYFQDDGTLASQYQAVGLQRSELQTHRQMIDALTLPNGPLSANGWAQKIDTATQSAQKLVGTNFVNRFNHFIVSDIGRQLADASGQTGQEALDTIGTFTNRSLGNTAAGQRAGVFSGPVGQAVGLFQSYQMNMMQQLFRHIGNGDAQAVAIGAAMQSSVFGLSSLPGFSALNQLIASQPGNTSHGDMYSGLHQLLGDKTADYLLYGSLSNVLGSALYSRGDLNPRRASILPTDPMQFPAVAAGVRTYDMLSQLTQQIGNGGSVPASLLLAAEHNGLSRPLTGLAELVQGFVTDPKGNMISTLQNPANQSPGGTSQNTAGYSDLFSLANMSRLLGARPLDEAVGMDAMYQSNAMKTLDRARLQELGEAAKTSLYNGDSMAPVQVEQTLSAYSRAGGNQANFNSWLLGQAKSANTSAVNKAFGVLGTPKNATTQLRMGGVPLPDFRNQGSTQVAATE